VFALPRAGLGPRSSSLATERTRTLITYYNSSRLIPQPPSWASSKITPLSFRLSLLRTKSGDSPIPYPSCLPFPARLGRRPGACMSYDVPSFISHHPTATVSFTYKERPFEGRYVSRSRRFTRISSVLRELDVPDQICNFSVRPLLISPLLLPPHRSRLFG
jgi:hypothetical protein